MSFNLKRAVSGCNESPATEAVAPNPKAGAIRAKKKRMTPQPRSDSDGPSVVCLVEPDARREDDLSAASRFVLREAAAAAGPSGELHVVCVIPPLPREVVFSAGELVRLLGEQQRIVAQMRRWLVAGVRKEVTRLTRASKFRTHVLAGSPPEELTLLAGVIGADLIVVPCHWSTVPRLMGLISRSAFDRVVRLAACPVMAALPAAREWPGRTSVLRVPDLFRKANGRSRSSRTS
jgi:nucleotide-binding universal stress UspA family protein